MLVPLYLQMHLGHTAFEASLMRVPSSIAAAISSQIAGRYVLTLGRRLVITGFAIAFTGLAGAALLAGFVESGALPFWALALPLNFMGISQGMTISQYLTLTMHSCDIR